MYSLSVILKIILFTHLFKSLKRSKRFLTNNKIKKDKAVIGLLRK